MGSAMYYRLDFGETMQQAWAGRWFEGLVTAALLLIFCAD
jgi:hypothetical protein